MTETTLSKKAQIFKACQQLHERGENITILRVGEELVRIGLVRGSDTTRSKYIHEWRKQEGFFENKKPALPEKSDKLSQIIDEIRIEIQREADDKISKITIDNEQKIKELSDVILFSQQEIAELRDERSKLETENYKLSQKIETLIEEKNNVEEKSLTEKVELEKEILVLQEKLTEKITHTDDLKKLFLLTAETHQKALSSHKEELSHVIELSEKQRHEHIRAIEAIKGQLSTKEKELIVSQKNEESLRHENSAHQQNLAAIESLAKSEQATWRGLIEKNTHFIESLNKKQSAMEQAFAKHAEKNTESLVKIHNNVISYTSESASMSLQLNRLENLLLSLSERKKEPS